MGEFATETEIHSTQRQRQRVGERVRMSKAEVLYYIYDLVNHTSPW